MGTAVTLLSTIPIFAAALHPYDVNGDGNVTVADFTYISTRMNGYKTSSYENLDVNNNGIFSMVDGNIVLDYAWNGASTSSVSVQNFGNLLVSNADITSISDSVTYKRYNCSTRTISEYTLTLPGTTETASTTSIQPPTPMEVDSGETAIVKITNPDGSLIGTGTIIDEHTIVTAAHCVYQEGFVDLNVRIVNTGYTVIASYNPSYIHIPKQYATNSSTLYDYALIYVEEDLSRYGKFELGVPLDSFITDTEGNYRIKVSGFPANMSSDYVPGAPNQDIFNIRRYVSEGSVIVVPGKTTNLIHYNTLTYYGDSGGPAYIDESYTFGDVEYSCKTLAGI